MIPEVPSIPIQQQDFFPVRRARVDILWHSRLLWWLLSCLLDREEVLLLDGDGRNFGNCRRCRLHHFEFFEQNDFWVFGLIDVVRDNPFPVYETWGSHFHPVFGCLYIILNKLKLLNYKLPRRCQG